MINKTDIVLNKYVGISCCFLTILYDWHAKIESPYIPGLLLVLAIFCMDRVDRRAKACDRQSAP